MKILFGVFDWGLGHATRDIPLIEELLKEKNKVDIISTGRSLKYLQSYFKNRCDFFDVPSISPPYTKTSFFVTSFIFYIPKMLKTLSNAHKITQKIIEKGKYDKIISDCRYDVYDKVENSYLINHQLRFKTVPIAQLITEFWLNLRMNKYKYVLVPDYPNKNITGILSHDLNFISKLKVKYIGILSHVQKKNLKKDIDYFISLSGPEPQRTILEKKILKHIDLLKGNIVMAGGNPDLKNNYKTKNLEMFSFLGSKDQEHYMNRAKFVITRSGYTTVMELCELDIKHALLIPTPGQTEQEYLGDIYDEHKYFHHEHQSEFDLLRDIEISRKCKGFEAPWKTRESVKKVMELIKH